MDERLRYVKAVIECRSFSEAAKKLHISQPALSAAIRKLEHELQVTLIERSPTRFTVTDAGWLAVKAADTLQRQKDDLFADLAKLKGERPRLRIGMIDSIAVQYCASKFLRPTSKHYALHISINDSAHLLRQLTDGNLDIIITLAQPAPAPQGYMTMSLGNEPMVLVGASALSRTKANNLISYPSDSFTALHVKRVLEAWGTPFIPYATSSSPEVMLTMVRQRLGVAVLPFHMVEQALHNGELEDWQPLTQPERTIPRPIALYAAAYEPTASDALAQQIRVILQQSNQRAMKMV